VPMARFDCDRRIRDSRWDMHGGRSNIFMFAAFFVGVFSGAPWFVKLWHIAYIWHIIGCSKAPPRGCGRGRSAGRELCVSSSLSSRHITPRARGSLPSPEVKTVQKAGAVHPLTNLNFKLESSTISQFTVPIFTTIVALTKRYFVTTDNVPPNPCLRVTRFSRATQLLQMQPLGPLLPSTATAG
jgi:hypothetical protein